MVEILTEVPSLGRGGWHRDGRRRGTWEGLGAIKAKMNCRLHEDGAGFDGGDEVAMADGVDLAGCTSSWVSVVVLERWVTALCLAARRVVQDSDVQVRVNRSSSNPCAPPP